MDSSLLKSDSFDTSEIFFMLLIGVFFGMVGQVVERPFIGILCGILLAILFTAYTLTLHTNEGVWSGLIAGIILGIVAAVISILLSRQLDALPASIQFGLVRGALFGAIAGLLTHALPEEDDPWHTKLFLIIGSTLMGAVFGGGVGFITGLFLGLVNHTLTGLAVLTVLGIVVGGYLTPIQHRWVFIVLTALIGAGTAVTL